MSNKNVKELVKNVIEENAVAFKTTLNRTLYSKIGQKLQEKYVQLSQNIFENMDPPRTPGGLDTPQFNQDNPVTLPGMGNSNNKPLADVFRTTTPRGVPPWKIMTPSVGDTYWYQGRQFRYNGGGWDVYVPGSNGQPGVWKPFWEGRQIYN